MIPLMQETRVVLPCSLGPTTLTKALAGMSRSTPSMAKVFRPEYFQPSPRMVTAFMPAPRSPTAARAVLSGECATEKAPKKIRATATPTSRASMARIRTPSRVRKAYFVWM